MSAKSVWSLPTPTFTPGRIFVPRWRTRTAPASTHAPANVFTPSRWPSESRPLRLLPAPFLCAMCLSLLLRSGDLRHAEVDERLTVTLTLPVAHLVLVLQDVDLFRSEERRVGKA